MSSFIPRTTFPVLDSIPRSYFLGHHKAGLAKMTSMLAQIDLIIECRDYRVPLTSRNPMFEQSLSGRHRMIIYTKRDLGSAGSLADRKKENLIKTWHAPDPVLFTSQHDKGSIRAVLDAAWTHSQRRVSMTGSRMMIVGMPNVGKSSLVNALRAHGVGKGKAARTGAQPGITRKIATSVKIIDGDQRCEGVYLVDTPGVFVPFVPDAEAMVKLALCGNVKDTIVQPVTLVDYLLFRINGFGLHGVYADYCPPTNDVGVLIDAVARRTGRLQKGGVTEDEATALWIIQRWRTGHLGRFMLDEVTQESLEAYSRGEDGAVGLSMNQAKKMYKEARRERQRAGSDDGDT